MVRNHELRGAGAVVGVTLFPPRLVHLPCRWFRLSAEQIDAINYGGLLLFKLGIFLFNLVPYIALRIVA